LTPRFSAAGEQVKSPRGLSVFEAKFRQEGHYNVRADEEGTYSVCFTNGAGMMEPAKTLSFTVIDTSRTQGQSELAKLGSSALGASLRLHQLLWG
jgi:hypothetical protein